MSAAIRIRPFAPADGPACHALRHRAFVEIFTGELSPTAVAAGADAYDATEFGALLTGLETVVAEEAAEGALGGGGPVGFCTVRFLDDTTAEILYLYVSSACRGRGIGRALGDWAERWLAECHPRIRALVLDTAVPRYNRGFWEALGFRAIGESRCRYPDGDVVALRLGKTVSARPPAQR
jgi:ribosomal protein S18 acetylase RimI-like enzyme